MARVSDWEKHRQLEHLIREAISCDMEDQGLQEEDIVFIDLMISEDLDCVFAYVNVDASSIDYPAFEEWTHERAYSYDDAVRIADYYFDLR